MGPIDYDSLESRCFYNTYCPFDPTIAINDQRSVVGCVALTMAVLRDYYRYPTKGVGGVSYYPTYQDGVPVYLIRLLIFLSKLIIMML